MHMERAPDMERKVELEELTNRFQAMAVAKEKKLVDPVVPSQPAVSTTMDKAIDKLTQSFEKLNVNIGALMQQNLGSQHSYQYGYPSMQLGLYGNGQNVEASAQGMSANVFTIERQNIENTCFYCFNCNPEYPPHRFRNRCPWYAYHLEKGTVHLNANDKLCFGPMREGVPEIRLQRGRLHGEQVRQQTAGTEYDEYLDGQPKKEVSTLSLTQ